MTTKVQFSIIKVLAEKYNFNFQDGITFLQKLKGNNVHIPMTAHEIVYDLMHKDWEQNLKDQGIKLSKRNSKLGCALCCLYQNLGEYVHIDQIKKYVQKSGFVLTGTDPLQVRHLSTQKGFNIIKRGKYEHCLVNMKTKNPSFISEKRISKLTPSIWEDLKKEYDFMCVNCGSKEGQPMRWKKTQMTALQQGHMDPRKNLTTDNCVPQCSFCNQQYKDKAIFNKRGCVIDFNKQGFH